MIPAIIYEVAPRNGSDHQLVHARWEPDGEHTRRVVIGSDLLHRQFFAGIAEKFSIEIRKKFAFSLKDISLER